VRGSEACMGVGYGWEKFLVTFHFAVASAAPLQKRLAEVMQSLWGWPTLCPGTLSFLLDQPLQRVPGSLHRTRMLRLGRVPVAGAKGRY